MPFIVAIFKGTTPNSIFPFQRRLIVYYSEYVVDATFEKCDARAYVYGSIHQGFYRSLFPTVSRLSLEYSPHGVYPHTLIDHLVYV